MNIKRAFSCFLALILVCFSLFSATSCKNNELYSEGEGELKVVCTVFAPFEFAREIGGDKVTVTILQDNGADLHNYTPTSATLEALANADVFLYIGGESDEKWVDSAISASGNKNLLSVCLIESVELIHAELKNDWSGHDHDHDHEEHSDHDHEHEGDEHIWTSPKNAILMVNAIKEAFCQKDSANSELYESRAEAYASRLSELDAKYAAAVADSTADLIVFADRFPFVYLMHDYLIPYVAAFSGCSTEVNASFDTLADLINTVKDHNLSCVMTIDGSTASIAQSVQNDTGCKILSLNSMQSITRSDIIAGADYIEIMTQNLEILKEALG